MRSRQYPDYLAHFGIKGMKWGVRRFQNKDGSYTAAGLKRRFGGGGGGSRRSGSGRARSGSGSNAEARKAKIKKALKIGAGVAGTAALAYGAYRLSKTGKGQAALKSVKEGYAGLAKKGEEVLANRKAARSQKRMANFAKKYGKSSSEVMNTPRGKIRQLARKGEKVLADRRNKKTFNSALASAKAFTTGQASRASNFAAKYGKSNAAVRGAKYASGAKAARAFNNAQVNRAANFAAKYGKTNRQLTDTPTRKLKRGIRSLANKGEQVLTDRRNKRNFRSGSAAAKSFNSSQVSKAANFAAKYGKSNAAVRGAKYASGAKAARAFNNSQMSKAANFAAKYGKSNSQLTNTPGRNIRRTLLKGRLGLQANAGKAASAVRGAYAKADNAYRTNAGVKAGVLGTSAVAGYATGRAIRKAINKRTGSSRSGSSSRRRRSTSRRR